MFTCEGLTQCYRTLVVHMESSRGQLRVTKFRQEISKEYDVFGAFTGRVYLCFR